MNERCLEARPTGWTATTGPAARTRSRSATPAIRTTPSTWRPPASVPDWAATARPSPAWDYYWQDDSYAREYNRPGDEIDSRDQHDLSLIFETNDGRRMARAWARNLQDDDNVRGHYVTSDTSGLFRNHFLTESRICGASVRLNF